MRDIAKVFRALSDETRLRIMGLVLSHHQVCVCEIEQVLGITQSKASRHLRYLRDAGLLEDERDGVVVNYRLLQDPGPEMWSVLEMLREMLAARRIPELTVPLTGIRARVAGKRQEG